MMCKSLRRIFLERPYFWGSMARLTGFFCACLQRRKKEIPDDTLKYVRKEQIERLFAWWGQRKLKKAQ
jgi:hypothetical protein